MAQGDPVHDPVAVFLHKHGRAVAHKQRLQGFVFVEVGLVLQKGAVELIGNRVDFPGEIHGDLRERTRTVAEAVLAKHQAGFVTGADPQDVEHFLHVTVLDLHKLPGAHDQSSENFVGRADHACLVGRRTVHDEAPQLLQLLTGVRGDEDVGPFHDGLGTGLALFVEEETPVLGVDRVGPAAGGDEDIRLRGIVQVVPDGDAFLVVRGDNERAFAAARLGL